MRILFVDAEDNSVIVQVISGICFDPEDNVVQIWTPEGDFWCCKDVSQYQYSLWCSSLVTTGYLLINGGGFKFTFDK